MAKETYREFKNRVALEGYRVYFDSICEGKKYYFMIAPDGRHTTGTLEELKEWIGE